MPTLPELLAKCQGGEDIDLTGQTVDPFYLRGNSAPKFGKPVTIHGGNFHLTQTQAESIDIAYRIDGAQNLHFAGGEFLSGAKEHTALVLIHGTDVAVRDCTFRGYKRGLAFNECDGAVSERNDFRDLRIDAMNFGGCRRVLAKHNYATDFFPVDIGGAGDHPDFIQFWPLYGNDNDQLEVIENFFERGDGLPVQGVFMRGIYEKDGVPVRPQFGRVTVKGNVIVGGLYNGISVSGANGGEVTGNTVVSARDGGELVDNVSWLRLGRNAPTVTVTGNRAERFMLDDGLAIDMAANTEAVVTEWTSPLSSDGGTSLPPEQPSDPDPLEPKVPDVQEPHDPGTAPDLDSHAALLLSTRDQINQAENALGRGLYRLDKLIAEVAA